ncbi:uncharacterized protein LOC131622761 [Vicia villosa]|uniref:uncharacterized protein LOC131622761 n=1 Tax=Vicia villosa TaxID=3911 RepID=UPI00273B63A5|nr:uncharacterized protein LOC131622761 [Vicia villosa]
MAISQQLYPSEDDLVYEEELLRNPFSLKSWWRYLIALSDSPFSKRFIIYERALKALPGSYKLWHAYLCERLQIVSSYPIILPQSKTLNDTSERTHPQFKILNDTFERALITMHKMPRIWIMYLQTLTHQKFISRTRKVFDLALRALPVTQHDRIWDHYLFFVCQKGIPIETSLRVYRRFLQFDPNRVEDFIEFLISSSLWQEAAERLALVLNDDKFYSIKGKTKHRLWLELCDLLTRHANEVSGLNVDAIIRAGIRKFSDEVGPLWTSLAEYYIRRGLHEKARDVFEEGMSTIITVKDFSVIFDSYSQFEESVVRYKMEAKDEANDEEEEGGDEDDIQLSVIGCMMDTEAEANEEGDDEDIRFKYEHFEKKILSGLWLNDKDDIDLGYDRLDYLVDRRPELSSSVALRQNPHNVEQWHRRVKLFEGNPTKQILTYTEAVRTVDPMKAVGKPHTLWVAFAKLYEQHNDLANARVIFDKAVQVNYKTMDNLASVWCEWAELELKHENFEGALELMKRATAEPSVEVKQKVVAGGNQPVQMRLHKSLRLWTFYADLEECLGNLESTREVYERILDLRIATPQVIINYAYFLEENNYFEDAFKVYERGVKIFKYPHARDIWVTYLSKFVKRHGRTKLERARELFENAVEMSPADQVKPLYLQYAKLEEDYGLAKRAMKVYDQATKAVPNNEKLSMYEIYIARAAEIFGVPKTREIYEQAIESGLPDKDVKAMCLKYAELERSLGEIERACGIYVFASKFADPRSDPDFWNKWHEFEVQHGNEDTFREMLRIKRSVSASYSQTHFILPENLMPKDQTVCPHEAKDKLKEAGNTDDEMTALERQLAPAADKTVTKKRKVGFVSAGVESHSDGRIKSNANHEEIELPEENDSDEEDQNEIALKDVPSAIFGGLIRKRDKIENDGEVNCGNMLGALERIKKLKRI